MRLRLKRTMLGVAFVFAAIQMIRPSRINPPIDPNLDIKSYEPVSPEVWPILARSCNDCHSYQTDWPWYSQVAPMSWLVAHDVSEGRRKMNLSRWGTYPLNKRLNLRKEICEEVTRGKMPTAAYTLIHTKARLSSADVQALCQWTRSPETTVSRSAE